MRLFYDTYAGNERLTPLVRDVLRGFRLALAEEIDKVVVTADHALLKAEGHAHVGHIPWPTRET